MNPLKKFPGREELINKHGRDLNSIPEVNGHIHTPYSFSAFESIEQAVKLAKEAGIEVLGINDFYVTDGYKPFLDHTQNARIFPLFNIEFIGLLNKEQANNIRVNDPNNPGRTYFSGKGLKYPFMVDPFYNCLLEGVKIESQIQVKKMVEKASKHLASIDESLQLRFYEIKNRYAQDLVRERHIAKAIRELVFQKESSPEGRKKLLSLIYGGIETSVDLDNNAALENEIRGILLKSGGIAFVPEDENAFLEIDQVINIIINAGGIPCYPVLLDDSKGNLTEYESDYEKLESELLKRKIRCIELIPGRNDFDILNEFVNYFDSHGFIISFGTEHNTPVLTPLKVETRNKPLSEDLKRISYEGACVIAAHQYLTSRGEQGVVNEKGEIKINEKNDFIHLGNAIIKEFTGN